MHITPQEIRFLLEELELMSKEERSNYHKTLIANLKEKLQEYEENSN